MVGLHHDFLPANYLQHLGNGWPWTGDCWKLAYELSQAKNIEFKIVEIDGGLMKKISNDYFVPDLSKNLIGSEFDKFLEKWPSFVFKKYIKKPGF